MNRKPNERDKYQCPKCDAFVAEGDEFCRYCGREYTEDDVETMKKNLKFRFFHQGQAYKFMDVFNCPECHTFIAYGNLFCKKCGTKITSEHVKNMNTYTKREVNNTLIGVVIFLLSAIFVFTLAFNTMLGQ